MAQFFVRLRSPSRQYRNPTHRRPAVLISFVALAALGLLGSLATAQPCDYCPFCPVPEAFVFPESICPGESAQLSAGFGRPCVWSPTDGLSDPLSCSTFATPSRSTTYSVALYDSWRHCPITFELTVLVGSTLAPRIRAPATASPGQSGLAANVAAYEPGYAATYDWTISNGEITSGQGSETITFSVSSRPREADRVMLSVVVHPYGGCTSEAGMASVAIDAPGGRRRPREIPFR